MLQKYDTIYKTRAVFPLDVSIPGYFFGDFPKNNSPTKKSKLMTMAGNGMNVGIGNFGRDKRRL